MRGRETANRLGAGGAGERERAGRRRGHGAIESIWHIASRVALSAGLHGRKGDGAEGRHLTWSRNLFSSRKDAKTTWYSTPFPPGVSMWQVAKLLWPTWKQTTSGRLPIMSGSLWDSWYRSKLNGLDWRGPYVTLSVRHSCAAAHHDVAATATAQGNANT